MSVAAVSAAQLRLPLRAAPPLAEKPFVSSACNADASARLGDDRHWPGGALALVGEAGSGKSHLAAIWRARVGAAPLETAEPGARAPLLAEDADRRADEPAYAEALFHALNHAARGWTPAVLVTGRTPPASWPCRLPDLRSRLNAMAVATLHKPDDALLRDLLVAFFRERSIRPDEALLGYLVRRIERSAEGAAAAVAALDEAERGGGRIGVKLAREILGDPLDPELPFEHG